MYRPFDVLDNVVFVDIGGVVAGDKVGLVDVIGGGYGLFTEPQVGNGNAARLFGVIGKISLSVKVGVVADDFNGVFVGTDGTVRAETPEFAGSGSLGGGVGMLLLLKRKLGNVVLDADGEALLGTLRPCCGKRR